MNGAECLVHTLIAGGVEVCFANPGTSELHFVAALDRVPGMRCVLGLFEGVVTGAADGYFRITGRPAATLLHLAPGLGNGLANLHNARKARSGILNIVGDHATFHRRHDSPLAGDVAGIGRAVSHWVETADDPRHLGPTAARAIEAARMPPGRIATLILPADTAWGDAGPVGKAAEPPAPPPPSESAVRAAAQALLAGRPAVLMLGGGALHGRALALAGRIAARTGCRLLAEPHGGRTERGAGRVPVERLPALPVPAARAGLEAVEVLVLAGAPVPVAFFAYPDQPSLLAPPGCAITTLAPPEADLEAALEALGEAVGAAGPAPTAPFAPPALPSGAITPDGIGAVLGALMPEHAIVVDEALTTGRGFARSTTQAAPHDWLNIAGGAIGFALPAAVGAAIAAPGRKVIALESDGSGMYTIQALWTMAREGLDILVLVFANRRYAILEGEFAQIGAGAPGPRAQDLLTIGRPDLDWVGLARAQGVEAGKAGDLEALAAQVRRGLAAQGPYLVQVDL